MPSVMGEITALFMAQVYPISQDECIFIPHLRHVEIVCCLQRVNSGG